MLLSVCEVISWLDWWLSTCGGVREHLTDEVRGNFERLVLSGSRALEFLGCQGVTALGNLVLSRRDSLLLDVRSIVPAEEVAHLRYAVLPSSAGLFPSALFDSALDKMRAVSNDALVQKTLNPPKIPRKSSVRAGLTFTSSANRGGASPVVPWSQKTASSSSAQQGGKQRGAKVRLPFRLPPVANVGMPEKSPPQGVLSVACGGLLSAHWRHWQAIGAESCVLSTLRDGYRTPFLDSPPPLARTPISFLTYRSGSPWSLFLGQVIEKMLAKDAVEIALDPGPGFYSRLFLVVKATRGWHPVIDLSHLNGFVQQTPFKVETVASVQLSVQEGNFVASIDLKDA